MVNYQTAAYKIILSFKLYPKHTFAIVACFRNMSKLSKFIRYEWVITKKLTLFDLTAVTGVLRFEGILGAGYTALEHTPLKSK